MRTVSPAVSVPIEAVAPELAPVIVSPAVNVPVCCTKLIGLDVSIILAVADEVVPVTFSPRTNVPTTEDIVIVGATASAEVS